MFGSWLYSFVHNLAVPHSGDTLHQSELPCVLMTNVSNSTTGTESGNQWSGTTKPGSHKYSPIARVAGNCPIVQHLQAKQHEAQEHNRKLLSALISLVTTEQWLLSFPILIERIIFMTQRSSNMLKNVQSNKSKITSPKQSTNYSSVVCHFTKPFRCASI